MAKDLEKLEAQGTRLRELKKQARVTVGQIADAVGITERQVQRWLAGESGPSGETLKALARYLGTTPDFIEYGMMRREQQKTPEPFPEAVPPDTAQLLAKLEAIERQLQKMQRDNEARALELRTRIDERTQPLQAPQRRRRA